MLFVSTDPSNQINSTTITTTPKEVGPGDIGNNACQGLSGKPAACNKNAECELDMDGTMCNKVGCLLGNCLLSFVMPVAVEPHALFDPDLLTLKHSQYG
jgi:hypothetical protein